MAVVSSGPPSGSLRAAKYDDAEFRAAKALAEGSPIWRALKAVSRQRRPVQVGSAVPLLRLRNERLLFKK